VATRSILIFGLVIVTLATLPMQTLSAGTDTINWSPIGRGVDYALIPFSSAGRFRGNVLVTRVEPSAVLFRVYYRPGERKTVQDWAVEMPGALLIVNASFSRAGRRAIGLVVISNQVVNPASGRPDSGRFEVEGELPQIGAMTAEQVGAMQTSKQYVDGFEGYPLLIDHGQPVGSIGAYDMGIRARRTVIAQDDKGRILIIVTSPVGPTEMTIAQMVSWLQNSTLGVVSALNLDGGLSSQIYIGSKDAPLEFKQGYASVPVVLAVYAR
jgi:Phosphodiester glycosidase